MAEWQRKFSHNGSFYYHPFPLVRVYCFGGNAVARTHSRNFEPTGTRLESSSVSLRAGVFRRRKGSFFLSPYSITHTHTPKTGNIWVRRWQTLSNVFRTHTPLAKQRETYLVQEGSKPTQVICRVRSPGRADTGRPHGVRAESFDKISLFGSAGLFQLRIKKCLRCEIYCAGVEGGGGGWQKRERPAQSAGA